jgi:hypothetical protein
MRESLSAELRPFIDQYIHSFAQLELLLFVSSDPVRWVTVAQAARAMCLSEEATHGFFETMRGAGLLEYGADCGYRFAPQ